jgi:membrane protease YdiL (CAAX protease family)
VNSPDENALEFEASERSSAFHDCTWATRSIIVGLTFLILWRGFFLFDREWLRQLPPALLWASAVVIFIFFLIFPFATRTLPEHPAPAKRVQWRRELGISIPIVLGAMVLLSVANYAVESMFPGETLSQPQIANGMVWSPNRLFIGIVLVIWFTIVPVAEEVFFRGFLHNAFRARMPLAAAVILQSAIFGALHFYDPLGNSVVFLVGLLLTLVYLWRGNLLAPIFVHAGFNFLGAAVVVASMFLQANAPVMGFRGHPSDATCIIHEIMPGSAAEEAGLQAGDTITSFDGEPVRDFTHLLETIRYYRAGEAVPVTVERSEKEFELTVVLRSRDDVSGR